MSLPNDIDLNSLAELEEREHNSSVWFDDSCTVAVAGNEQQSRFNGGEGGNSKRDTFSGRHAHLSFKKLEDDVRMLGLKIKHHEENINFMKTLRNKLDDSILDGQVGGDENSDFPRKMLVVGHHQVLTAAIRKLSQEGICPSRECDFSTDPPSCQGLCKCNEVVCELGNMDLPLDDDEEPIPE